MNNTHEQELLPRIGIMGAMEEELRYLLALLRDPKLLKHGGFCFHIGKLHEISVIILRCGIGKVNAAAGATILLDRFGVNTIINTGSAGGLRDNLRIGDIIVSTKVHYHDVNLTTFGYEPGQLPGMPAVFKADPDLIQQALKIGQSFESRIFSGAICTGDTFISTPQELEIVRKRFPKALACEMEAAAIAHTCHIYKCPFVIIRSLSDIAGVSSSATFKKFIAEAGKNAASLIESMIFERVNF